MQHRTAPLHRRIEAPGVEQVRLEEREPTGMGPCKVLQMGDFARIIQAAHRAVHRVALFQQQFHDP